MVVFESGRGKAFAVATFKPAREASVGSLFRYSPDPEFAAIRIEQDVFHGEWNYVIAPNTI